MAAKNYIKVALAFLLTLTLVICAVPMAFATETVAETSSADVETAAPAEDAETGAETAADTSSEDTSADSAEASDTEAVGTDAADTEAAETEAETAPVTDDSASEEEKGITTGTIVSIVIVAAIIIFAAVYCIKNKEKVAKFFREVKSECKKIVWTPWKTVRKNLFIVLVIIVIFTIAIGALDLLFSKGIIALGDLI